MSLRPSLLSSASRKGHCNLAGPGSLREGPSGDPCCSPGGNQLAGQREGLWLGEGEARWGHKGAGRFYSEQGRALKAAWKGHKACSERLWRPPGPGWPQKLRPSLRGLSPAGSPSAHSDSHSCFATSLLPSLSTTCSSLTRHTKDFVTLNKQGCRCRGASRHVTTQAALYSTGVPPPPPTTPHPAFALPGEGEDYY